MRENWPPLESLPGLSVSPYLGDSSLPPLLASRICICTSSFPEDDVTNLQRLYWDQSESWMLHRVSAPGLWASSWAILNVLLRVTPALPRNQSKAPLGGRSLSENRCHLATVLWPLNLRISKLHFRRYKILQISRCCNSVYFLQADRWPSGND